MVVGGGGREHAIIKKLKENKSVETVYALPGNGGIAQDAICVPIGAKEIDKIVDFAVQNKIDFAVVAPDDPLVLGCVYALNEKIPDNPNESQCAAILKTEGEKIKKHIEGYAIALCVEGENISSEKLADKISSITLSGNSTITFIIGGSLGIDNDIKSLADFKLSFSKMTFPHQLMRLILVEQIYRAFKINANESYHK